MCKCQNSESIKMQLKNPASVKPPHPNAWLVAGCDITAGQSAAHWFNPACFTLQDAGTIGNAGRSIGTSPGYVSTDFSLTKDTRISERVSAQLRAELFNIFNHTNLGLPAAGAFSSTGVNANAGAITNIIGNSRQIQFGLKLLF